MRNYYRYQDLHLAKDFNYNFRIFVFNKDNTKIKVISWNNKVFDVPNNGSSFEILIPKDKVSNQWNNDKLLTFYYDDLFDEDMCDNKEMLMDALYMAKLQDKSILSEEDIINIEACLNNDREKNNNLKKQKTNISRSF